jgi:glucokinase
MKQRLVFSMDIGGTRTKYGVVDLAEKRIIASLTLLTETKGQAELVQAAGDASRELSRQIGLRKGELIAGGVGVPGYVDGDHVSLVWESIAFIEGDIFRPSLQAELGFPIRMDNDARVAAMGEAYFGGHAAPRMWSLSGDADQPDRLLSLTLGTGVGVALVVDGQLLEKSSINHLAGHIPIRLGAGKCFCGFSGCLESLVSGPGLVQNFASYGLDKSIDEGAATDARRIFKLAERGNPGAKQAVTQLVDDLILGLNAYILLYGPDVIVLGGGLANSLGFWLPTIRKGIFAHPYTGYQVKVSLSTLGEQAGLFGAASLWANK